MRIFFEVGDNMDWDDRFLLDLCPSDQFPVWPDIKGEDYEDLRIVPVRKDAQLPPFHPPDSPLKQVVQEEIHESGNGIDVCKMCHKMIHTTSSRD